jgi:PAS domain S-box-containing protein
MDNNIKSNALNVLSLEDSAKDFEIINEKLINSGFNINITRVEKEKEFIDLLRKYKYDVILSDFKLPEFDAFVALQWCNDICPNIPFICVSGTVGEETAIELIKQGAVDYVLKDRLARLPLAVKRALNEANEKTKRRQAEESLRENNELLSLFIQNSPIYAFIKEVTPTESRVIKASENYIDMIGIPGSKMIDKTMEDLFPAEIAAKFTADDWSVVSEGKVLKLDEDLNERHYTTVKFPIKLGSKNLLAGYTIDITERKQAEKILLDLIEKNPMSIQITDKEGFTHKVNTAHSRLFGAVPPPEFSIFTDLKNKGFEEYILLAQKGEVVHFPEIYYNVHDIFPELPDKPVWIHAVLFPLLNPAGIIDRFVFIHEDITERKQIEIAKNEKEKEILSILAKFNHSQSIAKIGTFELDIPTGKVWWSDELYRIFEVDREKYTPSVEANAKFIHPEDNEPFHQSVFKAIETGEHIDYVVRIITRSSKLKYCRFLANVVFNENNKAITLIGTFNDITKNHLNEETLKAKNIFIDRIIETSALSTWISDENGTALQANPACLKFFGATEAEVIGKYNIFNDEVIEKQGFMPEIRKVFENGEVANIIIDYDFGEVQHVKAKNATHKTINSIFTPILDSNHKVTNIIVQTIDLTQILQMQKELLSQYSLLKALINSPKDILIFSLDKNYCYTTFNEKHHDEMKLAWNADIEIGTNLLECMSNIELRALAKISIDRALNGETFIELQHQPGINIDYELNWNPIYQDHEVIGVTVFIRDITERKQAELALLENEIKYRTLFETANDAILLFTEGSWVDCNEGALKVFGCTRDQIIGSNPGRFSPPTQPDGRSSEGEAMKLITLAFTEGPQSFEWVHCRADGSTFAAEVNLNRVDLGGKPYIQAIVRDVSERARSQKLMHLQTEILKILTTEISTSQITDEVVQVIKHLTGYDAVGLRLRTDSDYPFVASLGYSEDFLKSENSLLNKYPDGGLCMNADGTISLECTCGMILNEKTDLSNPIFTAGGSAFTNNSLQLLDVPPETDPRLRPRNRCIHVGFLSLALIPIRSGAEVMGLLHLADRKQDQFTPETISFFEGIASSIGVALARKQAENALHESFKRYKNLTDISPVGIFQTDEKGATTFVNPEWIKISGLSFEEAMGDGWLNAVHPDDKERLQQGWQKSTKLHKSSFSDYRFVHPDGKIAWVMGQAIPEINAENKIIGYIGTITNITWRKQVEDKLKESEQKLKEAQQMAHVGHWEYDPISHIFSGSDEAFRIYGFPDKTSVTFDDVVNCISKKEVDRVVPTLFNLIEKGVEFNEEFEICPNNSSEVRVLWSIAQMKEGLVSGILQDITERKLAEDKLKESEQKLREAQQMAHLGFWNWDINSGEVEWSDEVFKIFGLEPTNFKPQIDSILELSPWPEDHNRDQELINRAMESRKPGFYEQKFLRPNGSIGYYYSTFEGRYDENNELITIVGTVQDITERKQLENVHNFLSTAGYQSSGENFFETLADYLAQITDSEYVCIDKLIGEGLTAQTLAIYNEGKFDDNVSYTLKQTPCGDVVGKTICCFPENVCQLFPQDQALQELKAQSYIGTTLWSFDGKPIGLIAIIKQKPMENSAFAEKVLKLVAIRAAGEIERMQAEEKVKKIGKHYQALIENAPDGIVLIGTNGKFSYISPSAKKMFGYDIFETTTDNPDEYTHPDDLPYVLSILGKIIEEPSYIPTIQYRFMEKTGNWKWIESTFTNLIADSNINAIVINFRDINDRKIAEEKLQLSEEKYRLIADNTEDWIYWIKPDGNFQYISPSCEKLTGYSAQEFMDNPKLLENITYTDDRDIILAHHQKLTNENPSENLEYRIVTKNGEILWIQHSCSSIYNQEGEYAGRRGTNKNITLRREAEDKERLAHKRLRRFIDSSIVGIVIASSDGKIIETNDYYLNMLGYTRQEYESGMLDWRSITPPEWLPADENAIRELHEKGICTPYEKEYFHRNGNRIVVLLADAMLPGSEDEIAAFVLDITQRKRTEEALIENNSRLELAMQAANMAWWEMEMPSGNVIFNKRKAEMLGYPSEKFKHYTDFMALVHPEDAEKAMEAMRKHMYGAAAVYETEYRILTNSGEYKWFYDLGSVVRKDSDGKPLLIAGLVLDISKRKLSEEKILSQLSELIRWQKVIQGREDRNRELKKEVNELLVQMGEEIRYPSQEQNPPNG